MRDKVNSLVDTLDMGQLNVGSSEGQPLTHTTPPLNTGTVMTRHVEGKEMILRALKKYLYFFALFFFILFKPMSFLYKF